MTKEDLKEILARHAYDVCLEETDAKSVALRAGRCGSPFTYQVFKLAPDMFAVVTHIEAPLYRNLLEKEGIEQWRETSRRYSSPALWTR